MKNTAFSNHPKLPPRPIFHVVAEPDCALQDDCNISEVPSLHPTHHLEGHVWEEQGVSSFQLSECLVEEDPIVPGCPV